VKLSWRGFNEMASLITPLDWSDFIFTPKRVRIEDAWFEPKDELHITLISKRVGRILGEKISLDPVLAARIAKNFEAINWGYEPAGPVHIISRLRKKTEDEQATLCHEKTIILKLNMPGMTDFYEALKALDLISADTSTPPPHVTLYTLNCPTGISLASNKILDDLSCRTLSIMEFDDLCQCSPIPGP
jgi:hypothetical protein